MKTLFVDLAGAQQCFALVSDERTQSVAAIEDHRKEEQVMSALENLLKKEGWAYADLDRIACVIGPGGFMSLRVGVAMANALAYALKIPSAGIHASDLKHARVKEADHLWLHSTRRELLFIRGFGSFSKEWPEPTTISLDELKERQLDAAYVGELIPEHVQTLLSLKRSTNPQTLEEVLPQILEKLEYRKDRLLLPWYGREA